MARLATIKTLTGFDVSFHPRLAFHPLRGRNLGQPRPRSIATASWPLLAWTSSTATRWSISSAKAAPEKAISPQPSASKPSAPDAASTSPRSPTSSTASPKPIAKDGCANASAFFAAPNCSSSTVGPRSGLTGYLSVGATAGNLIFQLVNARYERGAMILTSNRGFSEWADVSGDPVVATALLDRLLHHAVVVQIEGASYRLRQHADLFPDALRPKPTPAPATDAPRRRHGRPRKPANLANTD